MAGNGEIGEGEGGIEKWAKEEEGDDRCEIGNPNSMFGVLRKKKVKWKWEQIGEIKREKELGEWAGVANG